MTSKKRERGKHSRSKQTTGPIEGLERAADATEGRQDWLVPGAIPTNCLVLIEGRKSTGKSSIAAAIAASLTGGPMVPGFRSCDRGAVVWCAAEEDWTTQVVPRLRDAGADLSAIFRPSKLLPDGKKRTLHLPEHLDDFRDLLTRIGAKLLVLDPFISMMSPTLDVRNEQQARLYLEPLADMCWEIGCTAILTRHLRKGTHGDAREQGLGSVAVANTCRSVLRCDEHPHEPGRSVLSVVAVNCAERMQSQAFSFFRFGDGQHKLAWHGSVSLDADAVAEGRGSEAERDEWHDADSVLFTMIGEDWTRCTEIAKAAEAAGVSLRTLRRAKARLHVPSRQKQVGREHFWEWGKPPDGWPQTVTERGTGGGARAQGERLGSDGHAKRQRNTGKRGQDDRRPRARVRPPRMPRKPPVEEPENATGIPGFCGSETQGNGTSGPRSEGLGSTVERGEQGAGPLPSEAL